MIVLKRLVDRLPVRATVLIAVACVAGGVALTLRPFTSVEVLVLLAGINAVLTGVLALASPDAQSSAHRWLVGGGWIVLGAVILAWPGLTVGALAVLIGLGLVAHGLVDVAGGVTGRVDGERSVAILEGLTAIVFGVLALAWPDVTVLIVAVLFGARTVLFGLSQLVSLFSRRSAVPADDAPALQGGRLRSTFRVASRVVGLVIAVGLLALSVVLHDDGRTVSAFYDTPAEIPETPGELLRTEAYDTGIPENAQAWLIMYSTQTSLGAPTVATAVVLAPKELPSGPRPLVAWTHGTVGIDRRCAPSLSDGPFADLPIGPLLDNGWVMVATDYAGMGTVGASSYLIGTGQAYSTLDSIRAAKQMPELSLSDDTAIWGHSQGGHAALWTGILADTYAPEIMIDGVAALSPATDLPAMSKAVQGQLGGALGSAYVITAYSETYDDVHFDDYVRPGASVEVREASKRCLSDPALLMSIITSLPATQSVFSADPTTGAAGRRLVENTPSALITAPLLVAQGTGDEVIPFSITEDWVAQRCAAGQHLEFVPYPDLTHMGVLQPDSGLPDKLISWTADRFAGEPPGPTC
ncbi:MAG TPA: lipase family protein [Ilumatobacter sp.]|nr:lipase family protein [Ilumatobacter sp.]